MTRGFLLVCINIILYKFKFCIKKATLKKIRIAFNSIDERVIFNYSPKYSTVLESPFTFTLVKLYFAKFFIDLSHFLPLKAD